MLAAGQATRLRPLTDHRPKCLLDLGGETILHRIVRLLRDRGLNDYVVVDGFCGDQIRTALTADFTDGTFRFVRNEDFAATNNAWSLLLALEALAADGDLTDPVFLLDSDIVCQESVLDKLLAATAPDRLGLRTEGEIGAEEMKVALDEQGRVRDLSKELPPATAAGESVGLEVFSAGFTGDLLGILRRRMHREQRVSEYYEASFVEAIRTGQVIVPVDLGASRCLEIDTAEDLAAARRFFGSS